MTRLPTQTPKVSVIMATYNCLETLPAALDSIRDQTYPNWELVVCDDGSTDGTWEFLQSAGEDPAYHLVLLRNPENRKLAYSLNRCLPVASGELIARMDGDDISDPTRLARQVQFLREHPQCDLVGTGMRRFDAAGPADVRLPVAHPDRFTLARATPFFHATILTYKSIYQALGGYTVRARTSRCEDYDLWFKFFAADFTGDNILEPLYWVREDAAAVRRRTRILRLRGYQTTLVGYRSLGYPWHWYVRPTLTMAGKVLVPHRAMQIYRGRQKARYLQRSEGAGPKGQTPEAGGRQ